MAHISVNKTGTQPVLEIYIVGDTTNVLTVPCLQDITLNNATGVYSYTAFCNADSLKLTTPGDNSIDVNVVVDDVAFFGDALATADSAPRLGVMGLSQNKVEVTFKLYWAGKSALTTDAVTVGNGFITSLAPTVSPSAPVWMSPITIAVNGSMTTQRNG